MEEVIVEQLDAPTQFELDNLGEDSAQQTEENLGTFQTSAELLKAYESLRAEFTRKCQEFAEFKRRGELYSPENSCPTVDSHGRMQSAPTKMVEHGRPMTAPTIRDYLLELTKQKISPVVIGVGSAQPITSIDPRRTMNEATKLAKNFFEGS